MLLILFALRSDLSFIDEPDALISLLALCQHRVHANKAKCIGTI